MVRALRTKGSGRVAQRESTPFTREGSQVQSLSRPPFVELEQNTFKCLHTLSSPMRNEATQSGSYVEARPRFPLSQHAQRWVPERANGASAMTFEFDAYKTQSELANNGYFTPNPGHARALLRPPCGATV